MSKDEKTTHDHFAGAGKMVGIGSNPDDHFAGAGKPIPGGKGAVRVVHDIDISRFAVKEYGGAKPYKNVIFWPGSTT